MRKVNLYREISKFSKYRKNPIPQVTLRPDAKSKVLNLNIIDTCNSKCIMCNIWKQEEELEISPNQLKEILTNPLFSELEHVGVTGGEPTLRDDIAEVFKKIIEAVPTVKGLSIITNAIKEDEVKLRITEIKKVCDDYQIPFSVMVSIDGVGKAHDKVRGIKGNFETAINVFNYLRYELKIEVSFGCTISKVNAWDADDLLYFAKKNKMYGRFRVAESINRLYNQDLNKVIRNFNDDETYNLLLFFEKLKSVFEKNETFNRTYSSIQQVLSGGDRLIGCPYHNDGIVLGSKGQLSYCAPKSKELGNSSQTSANDIFKNQFYEKERILRENCRNCIHDYHAPISPIEARLNKEKKLYNKYLQINQDDESIFISRILKRVSKSKNLTRIFIIGWYGTETVGDKAILGGIVDHYNKKYKDKVEYVIGSIYPFITKQTLKELSLKAKVVSTSSFDLIQYSKSSDLIVMGGGPLMDLHHLYIPLIGFKVAKYYKNHTVIFGCGIGPLKFDYNKVAVIKILKLSDVIKLRDKQSVDYLKTLMINKKVELSGDPAKRFINRISSNINPKKENILSCYLRDWTQEYYKGTKDEFNLVKPIFEKGIAKLIKQQAQKLNVVRIEFHHMHNFVIGNDDRDFSRYFVEKYFYDDSRVFIYKKLSTIETIVTQMKKSKFNICMRFHSVLFAHTLKTSFIAIDYTMGGKIKAYLEDNNSYDNIITVVNFINDSVE
ncbi:MAG: radical SAM protein [Bacteroidetes bacterium]|nr:MAG: radical SAM protein [Bacteroidota bacterium]